jgi:chemotaxis protein CheD
LGLKSNSDKVVGLGEVKVGRERGVLFSRALGSCVAVIVYDGEASVGGMAHIMLPYKLEDNPKRPGKYADTAVRELVRKLEECGGERRRMIAKIVGGARMFNGERFGNIGEENVRAVKKMLKLEKLKLVAEDTGGSYARSVEFDLSTGEIRVKSYVAGERKL